METPGRIAELERKFAENPRRYFAALANEFRKQGDLDRAIELCESHLAEQRNHLSGHVVLAQALVDAGRESDAWDPLHTALDLDPENFIALRLIGELSAKVGDVEHARTFYFRALEIEPRNEQLLAAVKNLSQRPAVPAAEPVEPPAADAALSTAARDPKEDAWGDITPLSGLESSTAFEAVEAAEPVAEEPADAGIIEISAPPEPLATQPGEQETDAKEQEEVAEPPVRDFEAEEPAVLDSPAVATPAHGDPFSDWLPSADSPVEPTEEEDWMSAAGSVASESGADTSPEREAPRSKSYDYHDWLPSLPSDTTDTAAAPGPADEVPAVPEGAEVTAAAAATEAAEATADTDELQPAAEAELAADESPPRADDAEARPMLASETMADLYLQQGHVSLAVDVLRELVASRPDDERLRARLAEVGRAAAAPPRETVRDMFARFARTAEPLRERTHPRATGERRSREAEPAGPLGEYFGDGATGSRDPGANALLAMVVPSAGPPPEAEELERWLAGLRRP